jgi:hypothetical protein
MNGAANERARAEADRVAAAAAGNQGGPPDAPPVVPPAAAAAALPVAGQVLIGAAALAQILEAVDARQRSGRSARMRTWEPWKNRMVSRRSSFWIS